MLIFISSSIFLTILIIAFFIMFKKTGTGLPNNSEVQQEENVSDFNYQGGVTAPITN